MFRPWEDRSERIQYLPSRTSSLVGDLEKVNIAMEIYRWKKERKKRKELLSEDVEDGYYLN